MTTATAQANPNIAFIKYRLANSVEVTAKFVIQAMIGALKVKV